MNKAKFYASLSNDDNGSYIVGNRFVRNSARLNADINISKKLLYSVGGSFTQSVNNRVDAAWSGGIGEAMSHALPYYPIYDSTGKYFMWNGGYSNPVAYREQRQWVNFEKRVLTNHSLTYLINDYWSLRATGSLDYLDQVEMIYMPIG
ncbi:MAG: hypothetical protein ACKOSR_09550, partial [Flavobacteriales bacterium]